jgi:hypothetical protein
MVWRLASGLLPRRDDGGGASASFGDTAVDSLGELLRKHSVERLLIELGRTTVGGGGPWRCGGLWRCGRGGLCGCGGRLCGAGRRS